MAKRILPYAFLLLMLAALVPLKGRFNPDIGPRVYDGDYFYGIARHVAEGFHAVKIKIGFDVAEDLAVIRAVRVEAP